MEKFFIIDLMPFLYKGHFVFLRSPRITSTGINTSALIGFANGVASILKDFDPAYAVLAMDPGGPTFRHEAYPPYKQQRDKMPEDLAANIPFAFELAEALNLPVVRCAGFEADDVMGTLARRAAEAGFDVYCATPDKDAAQLVGPHVRLFRPGHGKDAPEVYDVARVCEHWSLSSPAQMIDYLALAGDASDNIPGIRGVGEKTAQQLLATWGSVENLVAHAGELKGKLAEKVAAGAEDVKMSKFLTTIRTDVPLEMDLASFRRRAPDAEKLARVCAKYELAQFARRFGVEVTAPVAPIAETGPEAAPAARKTLADMPHDYRLITTADGARALAELLAAAPVFSFDTETSGTDPRTARLVVMSFATGPGRAWYVAVPPHDLKASAAPATRQDDLFGFAADVASGAAFLHAAEPGRATFAEACDFVRLFAAAFADPAKIRIAQNAKFDLTVLRRYGIVFGGAPRDTMLEHYVLDAAARHGMDALAREYLGYDPIPIERLIGEKTRGAEQRSMADLKPEEILDYAAEDADVTFRLDAVLRPLCAAAGLERVLAESEEPLTEVLADMEDAGVRIDVAALGDFARALEKDIRALEEQIRAYGGPDLNIDSPKQLGDLLFGELGLLKGHAAARKTSTGAWSTDEKTLQKIVEDHPIAQLLLDYRACTKLKSTYADKLPQYIDPADGRVHTTFAQAFTETGRLSSSNPNLQNIPVRTERGKYVRAAVTARDANHVLVSADYSQIELRLMAAMSGDEAMLAAFAAGTDIHRETAARVYGVPLADVTPEQRARCKMVNFGIIYGISAFGLAQRLRIPRREAADLIDAYFKLYPKVRAYMDAAVDRARAAGHAVTKLGRRRTLRDINSRNATARQAAERDAINTPIQGTAADLVKVAMVRVARALKREGLKAKLILQIHDELLFDAPRDEAERVAALAKREMEGALDLGVPLEVSVGIGRNWLDAH